MDAGAREKIASASPEHRCQPADLLPVRMLNESVYCARLYYLMHVMGEWAPSADTEEGRTIHRHVDRRQDAFPAAEPTDPDDPRVRARSIMLSSERLGIIAKMDVVEHAGDEAVPVDYKHGRPPRNPERAWLPERVQLCAQGLVLAEHGWLCDHGVLYFPASVNAMLSLGYTLLVRHFTAACALAGLDPHVGFFHADRPGRPSLALDLMEPFRPLIADSAVITAANNGEVDPGDFVTVGESCAFTSSGRKRFISSFERRLDIEVRHPVFGYRISYRRVIEVQTRLLARHVFGELERYPAFETR